MTKDWNRHVEALKQRLSELNETVDTIRAAVEERPGLSEATNAISSLLSSAESIDQGLSKFPQVVSEILENSVLGAVLIGPAGKFLLHNQTAGEILGYSFILHRSDDALMFVDEEGNRIAHDDLPWNLALAGEAISDKRLHIKTDVEDTGKWVTFSATPFLHDGEEVGGVMLFMLDTTEEVTLEESIESICSTISDQIAQVGSTQDQLQELASKLSKTGVQRLLTDKSAAGDLKESPTAKKYIARRHSEEESIISVPASEIETSDSEEIESESEEDHDLQFENLEAPQEEVVYQEEEESDEESQTYTESELSDDEEIESRETEPDEEEIQDEESYEAIEAYESENIQAEPVEEEDFQEEQRASRESLFGKMADVASAASGKEDGEAESSLPWPEVVDSEDYGQNLWEEYAQIDETTSSSWEEDEVDIQNQPSEEDEIQFQDLDREIENEFNGDQAQEEDSEQDFDEPLHEEALESFEEVEYHEVEGDEAEEAPQEFEEVDVDREPSIEAEFHHVEEGEAEEEVHEEEIHDGEVHEEIVEQKEEEEEEDKPKSKTEALRNALFGKKKRPRKTRSSGTYSAIGGPNELDASYMSEDPAASESLVVNYSAEEEVAEKPISNKILVVDDIPVNQKLLVLHLKRLGYEADVANNGKEALEAMEKQEYIVVLMNCDMPVMNGFEASTKIRASEAYSHRRVPIIALTSYDREGDREKCIAAGMDDYITKGSSRKQLKEVIDRSIVSAKEKIESTGGETIVHDEEIEADMEPLDINSMLKLYGQEEVEEIGRLFLSNMAAYIDCMQLAIDEKDADSVIHFANAVKGPCSALGMKLMTRLTTDIIEVSENADWSQVRIKYMRLKAVFVQTQEELKKVCPDDSLMTQ